MKSEKPKENIIAPESVKIPWDEIRSCKYDQTKEQGSSPFEICVNAVNYDEEAAEAFESPSQKKR